MPNKLETLQLILYLLPGFVTLRVKELLSFPNKGNDLSRVVDAIFLTFLNLFIFFVAKAIVPKDVFPVEAAGIISLFLIAVLVGIVLGHNGVVSGIYKGLRYLGITNLSGHVDAWSDAFNTYRGVYVRVRLPNSMEYMGWPEYYSDDPELKDLFLAEAHVRKVGAESSSQWEKIEGPGVLIPGKSDVVSVEFLDPIESKEEENGAER